MTESTNKNTLFYTAVIFASVAVASIGMMSHCGNQKNQSTTDSTAYYKMQLKIEKAQHGKIQVVLLNDAERERRLKIDAINAKEAAQQHEKQVVAYYTKKIQSVVKNAPDTCDEFIDELVDSYNQIIEAKDSTNKATTKALEQTHKELDTYYCLVDDFKAENKLDSTRYQQSETENANLKTELTQSTNKAHRAKVVSKVVAVIAAVAVIFNWAVGFGG